MWVDDPKQNEPDHPRRRCIRTRRLLDDEVAKLSATSPLVECFSTWPVDHQLGFTSTVGGTQPLIAYESLTNAARQALETTDFGAANFPFKNANFLNNLGEAKL